MRHYQRVFIPGATYFLTFNLARRHGTLLVDHIDALRKAFRSTQASHTFTTHAVVVLPDHVHCLVELPEGDADFPTRIRLIKSKFSRTLPKTESISHSRERKGERGIWQRRFWEHLIRDEVDFARHMDYVHYNPVKHGLVSRVGDWPYSSFHRLVKLGVYPANWGNRSSTMDLPYDSP